MGRHCPRNGGGEHWTIVPSNCSWFTVGQWGIAPFRFWHVGSCSLGVLTLLDTRVVAKEHVGCNGDRLIGMPFGIRFALVLTSLVGFQLARVQLGCEGRRVAVQQQRAQHCRCKGPSSKPLCIGFARLCGTACGIQPRVLRTNSSSTQLDICARRLLRHCELGAEVVDFGCDWYNFCSNGAHCANCDNRFSVCLSTPSSVGKDVVCCSLGCNQCRSCHWPAGRTTPQGAAVCVAVHALCVGKQRQVHASMHGQVGSHE
mmetsp:Transcript_28220/g.65254  ORF Transcript_28220/g.65254 Transcript_28220/m.65254 type:complete len:258 (-) Transcript_28220:754-1527(-)